ncbi:alkyl sulfatase BDS1-like metallo-beta-lactamase superfamily hydrolase [Clostridium pascui]|uniref:alkyl/aryl-sulfatase n=1 Tax=Clostridium pascui TaxID=46609 RepID=UPI0019594ABC|nr:alkyl sulfatase dimerization domain-containing protein [Clostridium pascui]MBM7868601.1 alkyl sulfatase BDS1-like metallo-beta-lactamase superfamily hydrolase [Clostridium pascui]
MEPSDNQDKERKISDLRKNATRKTMLINQETYKKMNWRKITTENNLAKTGMLVDGNLPVIKSEDQLIPVWDLRRYSFLYNNCIPYTANPKLWVQGNLNLNTGLFKVTDNIYQVRGFDFANMTFVKGNTGWIIIDCLSSKETAEAAINFVNDYFGQIPVSAVIITHSHEDHYGGILGVLDSFVKEDVKIYAPKNFVNSALEENVNVGVAMARRGIYMYGVELPKGEKGQIDNGIGKGQSIGTVTFTRNINEINEEYAEYIIDGVKMEFRLALDTEAPSEMFVYIPSERSLCIAEDCNATIHNLLTLRGAKVRDAVAWAKNIQKAIDLWGGTLTSVFGVHNWPRFGNQASIEYLEKQRDVYQYINDQTLRLINKGHTIEEVGRMVKLPRSLSDEWYNGEFYGTVIHNAKAVYQRYLGWYNGNPVDLNKLFPEESAKKYVEYMGGEDAVLTKARKSFIDGEYQWVAEVTKQVIYANPNNKEAKLICADALEQLGYIAESGPWRNEYLMGAQELRYGVIPVSGSFISEDVLNNLPLKDILYLLSIRIEGVKAGDLNYKINFIIPDRNEAALAEVKRGIFRYISDKLSKDAAVTVNMPKKVLYKLATTNEKPDTSKIKVQGDINKWNIFLSLQDTINQNFNIITPVPR